jgi:hypothetical protein
LLAAQPVGDAVITISDIDKLAKSYCVVGHS